MEKQTATHGKNGYVEASGSAGQINGKVTATEKSEEAIWSDPIKDTCSHLQIIKLSDEPCQTALHTEVYTVLQVSPQHPDITRCQAVNCTFNTWEPVVLYDSAPPARGYKSLNGKTSPQERCKANLNIRQTDCLEETNKESSCQVWLTGTRGVMLILKRSTEVRWKATTEDRVINKTQIWPFVAKVSHPAYPQQKLQ